MNLMSQWVVGGINIYTREYFFVEVIMKDLDTLKTVTFENVLPGSLIVTDEWRGY
ncbi:hypothetical protein H312_00893 [Anncaliia algerae PRA339]|uniref:ISXO2-like transposase domain-containing protein n=1 Tax=Anncaliia algerae PRA339 TaxID=1288291 RepID=A0A059F3D5_9MICR|nr:hypothetical protein H312_00893 [Anncaliia algerae PRA339]